MGQALLPENEVHGHLRMEACGVKYGQREIPLFDDEGKFSTSQNDGLCSTFSQLFHLLEHVVLALRLVNACVQLFVNNPLQLLTSSSRTGQQSFNSVVPLEPIHHKPVLHGVFCSD